MQPRSESHRGDVPRLSRFRPVVGRSRLVLEIASELVGQQGFGFPQAEVRLRAQGARNWQLSLFGSDAPAALESVHRGETTLAIVNPSAVLTVATRGIPPFRGPLDLRAIAVIPSEDQLVLAVRGDTGLVRLEEVGERRYPLRVSVRGQRDHSVHLVLDHVLQAAGWSLGDLPLWGGSVCYDPDPPMRGDRLRKAADGEADALFDEAAVSWLGEALACGMRVLQMSPQTLARLESWGYRRSVLLSSQWGLSRDTETIDFSGFAVYVSASAPHDLVRMICQALEKRASRITMQGGEGLSVSEACQGGPAAPLDVPFHDAAAEYWSERGYLGGGRQ